MLKTSLVSDGALHLPDVIGDRADGIRAVLFDELYNGAADDDAVGFLGDRCGLLRRRNAEADGARDVPGRFDAADHLAEVRDDLAAYASDAERRDDVDEALGLFGDGLYALAPTWGR
jgi:hypothetical protein